MTCGGGEGRGAWAEVCMVIVGGQVLSVVARNGMNAGAIWKGVLPPPPTCSSSSSSSSGMPVAAGQQQQLLLQHCQQRFRSSIEGMGQT